jgi:hypothetical protein
VFYWTHFSVYTLGFELIKKKWTKASEFVRTYTSYSFKFRIPWGQYLLFHDILPVEMCVKPKS